MRTSDGYRFGLQFRVLSDAHRQVGEFLESLGNKKAETVVTALTEYLQAHPEALNKDNPVKAVVTYGYTEETLNAMIEAHVRKIAGRQTVSVSSDEQQEQQGQPDADVNALDTLLNGLDRFA
ncbi:MAG TPA: hypothetical protein DEB31_00990 [Clostridiales bacterium]|nr:hypothetical protein [Clostridiales bacterium]